MLRSVVHGLTVAALLAGCCSLRADEGAALPAAEKAAGFQPLFNGRDLTGWQHAGNWRVEQGVITRVDRGGNLTYVAAALPDDFELRFEWKVAEGSNSGVYYRPGQYEYQVLDNAAHRDGKNPRTSAASLYFCLPPARDATRPVGEWNLGRIVCQGSVIQHWLNGEKVIDFDYTDPRYAQQVELLRQRGGNLADRGGHLYLQDHGDPVWYRNIRLRAIPADEQLERSEVTPASIPPEALEYERSVIERLQKARAK